MAQQFDAEHPDGILSRAWRAFVLRDRFSLTTGCVISILLTLWLAGMLGVPPTPGRAGSLLQQPNWPAAIGVACALVVACTALSAVVASHLHYEGGLFCGCAALAALSVQLGTMRFALFEATGTGVYLLFALELLLLYAAVVAAWAVLRYWTHVGWLPIEPVFDDIPDEPLDQKLLATSSQAVVTLVLMLLLSNSDTKAQSLASIGIASYLAAMAAHHFIPTQPSAWYFVGPLLVGLIGYVSHYFSAADWVIGDARGFFAPLARPLPIDYAAMGPAGALMGYWASQHWQRAHHLLDDQTDTPAAASH
jgi:hypothetical protein